MRVVAMPGWRWRVLERRLDAGPKTIRVGQLQIHVRSSPQLLANQKQGLVKMTDDMESDQTNAHCCVWGI